jgi:hypothetical protein
MLGMLFKFPLYVAVIVMILWFVSEYVVEELPEESVPTDWPKPPVLLLVLQVTVPVGLDPDTVAVHVTAEPTETGLTEKVMRSHVGPGPIQGCMRG